MKTIFITLLAMSFFACKKEERCQTCVTNLIISASGIPDMRESVSQEVCEDVIEYKKKNSGTVKQGSVTITSITNCFITQEIKPF